MKARTASLLRSTTCIAFIACIAFAVFTLAAVTGCGNGGEQKKSEGKLYAGVPVTPVPCDQIETSGHQAAGRGCVDFEERLDWSTEQRRRFRVMIPKDTTDEKIEAAAKALAEEKIQANADIDGLQVYAFKEGMDVNSAAYGYLTWAPKGNWDDVRNTDDRSDYEFLFEISPLYKD